MKSKKPLRFLHVSTRYGLRVVSASPYITEFVKLLDGVTYRRAEPKPKRPGAARRARLAIERLQLAAWYRLAARNTAKASVTP